MSKTLTVPVFTELIVQERTFWGLSWKSVVRTPYSLQGAQGSVPGQETEIPCYGRAKGNTLLEASWDLEGSPTVLLSVM